MNRPRLYRGLRIAASAVCGVACVLLVVLWVRSIDKPTGLSPFALFEVQDIGIYSRDGRMYAVKAPFVRLRASPPISHTWVGFELRYQDTPPRDTAKVDASWRDFFLIFWSRTNWEFGSPHCFLILFTATLAAVPWIRWRYSLKTMLVATATISALLGLGVWLARG